MFFVLGTLFAATGITPWVLQLFPNASYPVDFHRLMMLDGFILSFTLGYFSYQTRIAKIKKYFLVIFLVGATFFTIVGNYPLHYLTVSVLLALSIFFYQPLSFWTRSGLATWCASSLGFYFVYSGNLDALVFSGLLSDLHSNGAITAIAIGATLNKPSRAPLLLFFSSFFLNRLIPVEFCLYLRALVISYIAFSQWKIHRRPLPATRLTWGFWMAAWCVLLGYWLIIFWNQQYIHALHQILIGGFSLTALLSVIYILKKGEGRRHVVWINSLILFSTATRLFAPVIPQIYLRHLAYSAVLWSLGVGIWVWLTLSTLNDK